MPQKRPIQREHHDKIPLSEPDEIMLAILDRLEKLPDDQLLAVAPMFEKYRHAHEAPSENKNIKKLRVELRLAACRARRTESEVLPEMVAALRRISQSARSS